MNTSFGNTAVTAWKRIKLQHMALVCGLAIAASAAVVLAEQEAPKPSPVQSRVQSVVVQPRTQRVFVYYLVSSREDEVTLRSALDTDSAAYEGQQPGFEFATLVVDTPESEALAAYLSWDLWHYVPDGRIVDMRSR
ncbi:MAG TPA: hypothetical protein VJB57_06010 [Dehalococcoidia bacterium]|nr:hypothetical protein [Dehalococcoidia bacterium]